MKTTRRSFMQGLSAVLGAFALPWKGEAKEPVTTQVTHTKLRKYVPD